MDEKQKKNRPRFKRVSSTKPVLLTERDIVVFEMLRDFRFLRSTHIAALAAKRLPESSEDKLKRRLSALFHAGYIDRPLSQRRFFVEDGSQPLVYALSHAGAVALRDYRGLEFLPGITNRNKTVTNPAIMHTLSIADVLVGIEVAAGERFISKAELLGDEKLRSLSLRVRVPGEGREIREESVLPDGYFGLKNADSSKSLFFLEADRGSMPVVRSNEKQTSLLMKVKGYIVARQDGLFEKAFGYNAIRTLFVFPGRERAINLFKAVMELTEERGSRQMLYATYADFLSGDVMERRFLTGKGQEVLLTE